MSKQARKLRRIISLLLSAVMAVSCFSVSAAAACEKSGAVGKAVSGDSVGAPAPEHPRIYFTDNQGWDKVYLFAWDEDGYPLGAGWPGVQMYPTRQNIYGEPVYEMTVFGAAGFVFNSGADGDMTIDIVENDYDDKCYYTTGERDSNGHLVVYTCDYVCNDRDIQVINNRNWDDVYVYTRSFDGNEPEGEWPGKKITSDGTDDYGIEIYKYSYYSYNAEEIIFNNGKDEQTVDITDYKMWTYYITNKTDESGNYLVGSASEMDYHYGDVDCDGSITIGDATDISFHLAQFESRELSYLQKALADVNADGVVSIADVTSIQFRLAELDDNSRTDEICRLLNKGSNSLFLCSELDWENTYVYATDKDGNPLCGDWPGALLPQPWSYSENIFFSLPLETERVVFSCGNKRTVEVAKFTLSSGFFDLIIKDSKDENGNYIAKVYNRHTRSQDSVFGFTESQGWEDVYVYAWDEDGNLIMGDWPGTAMSYYGDNDFGDPVYTMIIPKDAIGIVFNSGKDGDQTVDVDVNLLTGEDRFYTDGIRDGLGHLYVYSW